MSLNETCSEDSTVHYLSGIYRSVFSLKQEDVSSLLLFTFALVYAIK